MTKKAPAPATEKSTAKSAAKAPKPSAKSTAKATTKATAAKSADQATAETRAQALAAQAQAEVQTQADAGAEADAAQAAAGTDADAIADAHAQAEVTADTKSMSLDIRERVELELDETKLSAEDALKRLMKSARKHNSDIDEGQVRKAFDFAVHAHVGQKRRSGEDFVVHPLGVARILAELNMDTTTVVAAILHDTVEDTDASIEDIRREFGDDIATIIDGLTKLGAIKAVPQEEAQSDNIRRMIIAMARDIRVIVIKLADRLHNMQTLRALTPDKQVKKARETLEIYGPLAHRLGIHQLKWQLEDLAFYFLEPQKYMQIEKMVDQRRQEREAYLSTVVRTIRKELRNHDIPAKIVGRPKHYYSIYEKMVQRGKEFSEIHDLSGLRVIVDSVQDCYAALGTLHTLWIPIPGRFKDYIAVPKFNGYQSLHTTVIGPAGRPLEIQIRTKEQHMIAEYGIAAHFNYKEGEQASKDSLRWIEDIVEWQDETKDPRDFMETLRIDLFENEVFVFSPKGKVVSLPVGATPIDFAYAVHTDVGHQCVGAKVNNRIVPLEYRLNHGDIVEVLTAKNSGPSRDWLQMVRTARARNKIRQWFSKHSRQDSLQQGKELLQSLIRKQHLSVQSYMSQTYLERVCAEMNFKSLDDLWASIGQGNTSPHQVITKLIHLANKERGDEGKTDEDIITTVISTGKQAQARSQRKKARMGVRVRGVDDVLIRLAKCCNPVPGDDIIGFVTRGRGISVHRTTCLNAQALLKSPERNIEVSWDVSEAASFPVEIEVHCIDRKGLLRDITTAVSDANVNILNASVGTARDRTAVFRFVFEIGSVEHLTSILQSIRRIDAVMDAYRVLPQAAVERGHS